MVEMLSRVRRAFAIAVVGWALMQPQAASAGLLTTGSALANFSFKGAAVDYNPDPGVFTLAANPAATPDEAIDAPNAGLHLSARIDENGNLLSGEIRMFGSIPSARSRAQADLLSGSVRQLSWDTKGGGPLAFLIDRDRIGGKLANVYRGAGIFVLVDGLDDVDWVNGFKDAETTVQLLRLEEQVAASPLNGGAVPVPGTLLMLLAGLPLLAYRMRAG